MEEKNFQYLVPSNVSTKFEFFEGFGWKELIIVASACLIGILFFIGLSKIERQVYIKPDDKLMISKEENEINEDGLIETSEPVISLGVRLFFIIIPTAFSFLLVKREENMSLLELIKNVNNFKKRQKIYIYVYKSGGRDGI